MRISDWSSDVCSSDLPDFLAFLAHIAKLGTAICKLPPTGTTLATPQAAQTSSAGFASDEPLAHCVPVPHRDLQVQPLRSEERRVGKECVSTFRSWWSHDH